MSQLLSISFPFSSISQEELSIIRKRSRIPIKSPDWNIIAEGGPKWRKLLCVCLPHRQQFGGRRQRIKFICFFDWIHSNNFGLQSELLLLLLSYTRKQMLPSKYRNCFLFPFSFLFLLRSGQCRSVYEKNLCVCVGTVPFYNVLVYVPSREKKNIFYDAQVFTFPSHISLF